MTYSWGHNRRFNAASNAIKKEFGSRVQKVTIDAGFTCPNRDGTKSNGGCTFCNNDAFNPNYCQPEKSVSQQIQDGISFHESRYKRAAKYMAYFQAYSNTYASDSKLRKLYFEALEYDKVIGLIIGTRPDCLDDSILDLLSEINEKYALTVEFGIESVYNSTLEKINRGHSFEDAKRAIELCAERNIKCGGHIILGLPDETNEMMLSAATILSELKLHSLKLHQLQYVKGTRIGEEFIADPTSFKQFELDEYIDLAISFLELLNPKIVVERLAGETQPDLNLGLGWDIRYDQVLQKIEKKMEEQGTWQGKKYIK